MPTRYFSLSVPLIWFSRLVADVEVIFQRALAATGHDGDLVQTSIQCFFNAILDQWLVDHRQHFLGHGFGSGQEASTVAGCREQAFLDHKRPYKRLGLWNSAQSNQAAVTLQCPLVSTDAIIEISQCR